MKTPAFPTAPPGDGRSLSFSFSPPNLENKLLAQRSTLAKPSPCSTLLNLSSKPLVSPSLQSSGLTSTTSRLLSTALPASSFSSSLLSTQNKLLNTGLPLSQATSLGGSALLNPFVQSGEIKESKTPDSPVEICGISEDTSVYTEEDVDMSEESSMSEEEGVPALAVLKSPYQKKDLVVDLRDEEEAELMKPVEFEELKQEQKNKDEEINDKKYLLLNVVCCSLVNKSKPPGQEEWNSEDSVWTRITNLSKDISEHDPQFLLKVAVYTRQELNIRITANFLLALAANLSSTKSHVRRYFCAAVQLPSDWLEVVRIYSTCYSRSLPMCLKKGLTDKFKQFSEYQLAKYNTRKHRCKHNSKKPKRKDPSEAQLKKWADLVRSEASMIRKLCMGDPKKKVVDKKQIEFSLKKMIQRLHIKEPAENVMAVLGRKYPSDAKAFTHSGMKGTWDRERAGQRMKLKEPETWERLLSREGNKAQTWEKLIDNNSLPFMAMLRNLRNMIVTGISEAHHKKILSKLTNKKAVIQSRQFPIRFLAAYKVIMELQTLAASEEKPVPTLKDILKEVLKKIPQSKRFKGQDWDKTPKSRLRATLAMPLVYRLYKSRRAHFASAGKKNYSLKLLQRYKDALEKAVQTSCRYNIPPLPGKTMVLLNTNMSDPAKNLDFYLPPDPNKPSEEETAEETVPGRRRRRKPEDPLAPNLLELGTLLALMIGSSAEDFTLILHMWNHIENFKLQKDTLLENVREVVKRCKQLEDMTCEERKEEQKKSGGISFAQKDKVDNFIVVSERWIQHDIEWLLKQYKNNVNTNALFIKVFLAAEEAQFSSDRNQVTLAGFSEQMLRFVAERGSSRLLDHVEHLDKVYNVPPPEGAKEPLTGSTMVSIPASPNMRWQGVRVFISSTFRDMHSERDVLVRSVFPELRRRAAPHCLYLQEVELRWGVTEEEQGRTAELCLNEVCRSQLMVVLLGERYGLVPPKPSLPELPHFSWLSTAPEGLSITEMEIRQFAALYPNANERMFCYFRDPSISKSVPVAWKADFAPESREAESKMADLKTWLKQSEAKVTENYPSQWAGADDGKPCLKNLELFSASVLEDLWTAVKTQFIEAEDEFSPDSDVSEQEVHQESLRRQFFGRSKLLSAAESLVEYAQAKGGILVLEAGPGEGKTVFMAAFGHALKTIKRKPTREVKSYSAAASASLRAKQKTTRDVIAYSATASQSARSVKSLLRFLLKRFNGVSQAESRPYPELVSEFHTVLSEHDKNDPLVILVDGVDLLQDDSGNIISDWIPQHLPQGVCLVVSVQTSSSLIQTLSKKRGTQLFSLAQLTMNDRREIVEKRLDSFGKKLSDTAFNNQVQTLISKKGAVSPLYLHLACEDLRNFASFDRLKDSLQTLPESLPQLVRFSLERICSENRGIPGLHWALAALTVSSNGLKERDLYAIFNTCSELSSPAGALTWDRALDMSRKPRGRVAMANFTRIVLSLQSLLAPSNCADTNDLLLLSNPEVRRAFEEFFLPTERDRSRAHLLLAAHLWTLADPTGADTFLHCEASSVMQLPHSLMESDQSDALQSLLSSYFFLFANVRHGLLHHLLEIYSSFGHVDGVADDCLSFLKRHSVLLTSWPALFVQQALNEPPETTAHAWAQNMMRKRGARAVEWLNNSHGQDFSALVSSLPSEPSCLVLSPDGRMIVVGTGRGTLHFINAHTGQMMRALVSSCDGVSSCVFVKDGSLATTSFDGKIEMWDVTNGCRTALVSGHNNAITGSDLSVDQIHLATVSLDSTLKVWSSSKGEHVASLSSCCPMNCVSFDPEGHTLAAGCWNGQVTVWNWLQNKTVATLLGHSHSIHSLSFSSTSLLCSGSVSGEVRVWSVSSSSCVGCFQAHSGSTEALTFVDNGARLLTAGADHMLQLWSGGLGRSVITLPNEKSPADGEPPQKRRRAPPAGPAQCTAVTGETIAVGTRDGLHLYSLGTVSLGEKIWFSDEFPSPVHSLLWVSLPSDSDMETDSNHGSQQSSSSSSSSSRARACSRSNSSSSSSMCESETELLLVGRQSGEVQVWSKHDSGFTRGLKMTSTLRFHRNSVLALAQNDTHFASASEDCSVALWARSELPDCDAPHSVLRGHNGGVTCLSFSMDQAWLLSGSKDQALTLWQLSPTPVLSKTFHHCHRDWITGCAWTNGNMVTTSNDGRLCFWDLATGKSVKEISWNCPLTAVCCQPPYVVVGSSDGGLHVWNHETGAELCHISAHKQAILHCTVVRSSDGNESNPENLTVVTSSEDGTAKVWQPLQVEHCGTFTGHAGAIRAVVPKTEGSELLTVSEDGSVRCWDWTKDSPPIRKGSVTALCLCLENSLLVSGFECGSLEFWQNSRLIATKQVSKAAVTCVCAMPDGQIAVGFKERHIDIFKVELNEQGTVSLSKVETYDVAEPMVSLMFCSSLHGVDANSLIFSVGKYEDVWRHQIYSWNQSRQFLGWIRNDDKSVWFVGEDGDALYLAFMFSLGAKCELNSAFAEIRVESPEEHKGDLITAATMDNDFIVCGDVRGNMWHNLSPDVSSWSSRKKVHSDKITALRLTKTTIVSASLDNTIKIWDRETKKQLGLFVCRAPVVLLELCPEDGSKLVCGDKLGNVYFLSWTQ